MAAMADIRIPGEDEPLNCEQSVAGHPFLDGEEADEDYDDDDDDNDGSLAAALRDALQPRPSSEPEQAVEDDSFEEIDLVEMEKELYNATAGCSLPAQFQTLVEVGNACLDTDTEVDGTAREDTLTPSGPSHEFVSPPALAVPPAPPMPPLPLLVDEQTARKAMEIEEPVEAEIGHSLEVRVPRQQQDQNQEEAMQGELLVHPIHEEADAFKASPELKRLLSEVNPAITARCLRNTVANESPAHEQIGALDDDHVRVPGGQQMEQEDTPDIARDTSLTAHLPSPSARATAQPQLNEVSPAEGLPDLQSEDQDAGVEKADWRRKVVAMNRIPAPRRKVIASAPEAERLESSTPSQLLASAEVDKAISDCGGDAQDSTVDVNDGSCAVSEEADCSKSELRVQEAMAKVTKSKAAMVHPTPKALMAKPTPKAAMAKPTQNEVAPLPVAMPAPPPPRLLPLQPLPPPPPPQPPMPQPSVSPSLEVPTQGCPVPAPSLSSIPTIPVDNSIPQAKPVPTHVEVSNGFPHQSAGTLYWQSHMNQGFLPTTTPACVPGVFPNIFGMGSPHAGYSLLMAETYRELLSRSQVPDAFTKMSLHDQALAWKAAVANSSANTLHAAGTCSKAAPFPPGKPVVADCHEQPPPPPEEQMPPLPIEQKPPPPPEESLKAAAASLAAAFSEDAPEEPMSKRPRLSIEGQGDGPPSPAPPLPRELGPLLPDPPRFGWLPAKTSCRRCRKAVVDRGGVFCGRPVSGGGIHGCGAAVCWRCMNRAPLQELGKIRTTKAEFESLGDDAWWMHEACMDEEDRAGYYAAGARGGGSGGGGDEVDGGSKFAWE